ncbi:MAG: hypothetical protein P8Z37_09060 [Acidobacteriota bacterium]
MIYSWILDSGGAGRGAWQGGILFEFMRWCRRNESFPAITMGASAGGYAAADVATGTEKTVMKGWTVWGSREQLQRTASLNDDGNASFNGFRKHLCASIQYVMEDAELDGVYNGDTRKKLVVFTTRARRRDERKFQGTDRFRYFLKTATRKLHRPFKYLPGGYIEETVVFAANLPEQLRSEYVRPLTRSNYHAVLEASCLVPLAMGSPLTPEAISTEYPEADSGSVFFDGSYTLKMPMGVFEEDPRFQDLAQWVRADKTLVFCCDPRGVLWENSMRLRSLNSLPDVRRALEENRLLVIYPEHKIEAGFLSTDNPTIMRTFNRGREQADRLLQSDRVRRFFQI